ncbi:hypothetical protein IF1G_04694 [Cordyceps javanica]|uniref:Uncharacterized protein n=1 Tax=Cordyceps javanica TaxID=43265 RepID=A0A545V330_9HYPO|nr:hypothetical protein IF1G_04694 [Cordyceps javanica]TQW07408.1 hypothetical protein IF2G_04569 [Cordyceps javanica]
MQCACSPCMYVYWYFLLQCTYAHASTHIDIQIGRPLVMRINSLEQSLAESLDM